MRDWYQFFTHIKAQAASARRNAPINYKGVMRNDNI